MAGYKVHYIPILKTTGSELKGYSNLDVDIKKKLTPLFELTRDRTHKELYPEGRLEVALKKALEAQETGSLLLDLTSHEDLSNSQIEQLFLQDNGYKNWTDFIKSTNQCHRIIPVIQIDADAYDLNPNIADTNIKKQASELINICPKIALRASLDIEPAELLGYINVIFGAGINQNQLIIIFDAEYIRPYTHINYAEEIINRITFVNVNCQATLFAVSASSFPKSVLESNYGNDDYGNFNIEEVYLHKNLIGKMPAGTKLIYSDYASVHPVRYETRGGSWVPRVDMPLESDLYYYRYRRNDGSYKKAATLACSNPMFSKGVPCWGVEQIVTAQTKPEGNSPSHWIAVRLNIHMTTQYKRVKNLP